MSLANLYIGSVNIEPYSGSSTCVFPVITDLSSGAELYKNQNEHATYLDEKLKQGHKSLQPNKNKKKNKKKNKQPKVLNGKKPKSIDGKKGLSKTLNKAQSKKSNVMDCNIDIDITTLQDQISPLKIKGVGSMGDSNTAAMAALGKKYNMLSLYEARGISFFTGGDFDAKTVSNYVKYYAEDVEGQSFHKRHPSFIFEDQRLPYADYHPVKIDGLNGAVSGATVINTQAQAEYIIEQVKFGKHNDLANEYNETLAFSFLVGINDACTNGIVGTEPRGPSEYFNEVVNTLNTLVNGLDKSNLFINLIGYFQPSKIYDYMKTNKYCEKVFSNLPFYCHAAVGNSQKAQEQRDAMDCLIDEYNDALLQIADNYFEASQGSPEPNRKVSIVYHPFLADFDVTEYPEFLSEAECFHISAKGQEMVATTLWNSMISPPLDRDSIEMTPNLKPVCLQDNTYLTPQRPTQ